MRSGEFHGYVRRVTHVCRLLATLTVVAAVAAGVASGSASVAAGVVPLGTDRVLPVATHGCSTPVPATASGFTRMFADLSGPAWSGGDAAVSVLLPDGRTAWLFADTMQGTKSPSGGYRAGARMVHNSMVLQDRGCLTGVTGPDRGELIPNAGLAYFWPTSAVVDHGRLYVFVQRMLTTGSTAWSFVETGTSVAVFALPAHGDPVYLGTYPTPSASAPDSSPEWGAGVVCSGGYAYVYGTRNVHRYLVFGKALYAARVPAGSEAQASAYRFWTGSSWAVSASAATPIIAAVRGVSQAVSVVGSGSRVVVVSKQDEFVGRFVVAWTAPAPQGPFTESRPHLADVPSGARPGELTYLPEAHPQFHLASGKELVSVCRNNSDPAVVLSDADYYKPQFIEVELPRP